MRTSETFEHKRKKSAIGQSKLECFFPASLWVFLTPAWNEVHLKLQQNITKPNSIPRTEILKNHWFYVLELIPLMKFTTNFKLVKTEIFIPGMSNFMSQEWFFYKNFIPLKKNTMKLFQIKTNGGKCEWSAFLLENSFHSVYLLLGVLI